MNFKKNLPYIIILIVVVGGIVFASLKFFKKADHQSETAAAQDPIDPNNRGQGANGRSWGGGQGGNRPSMKPLHGTVSSTSSDAIVMKADDGSSKNISISPDTLISRMDNGQRETLTISDVKNGDEINVMAEDSSQSTITPRMIIIGTFSMPQRGQSGGYPGGSSNYQDQSGPPDSNPGSSSI